MKIGPLDKANNTRRYEKSGGGESIVAEFAKRNSATVAHQMP
jgi:hypothetical protein